jgi:alkylation response protein AidB-like acyl-CoA dehydrogenase
VESGRSFFLFDADVKTGGALYGLGPTALAGLGHAGWGLGVAQRALDEIEQIAAGGRTRINGVSLRDQSTFQRGFTEKTLALRSARLLVHDMFGGLVDRLGRGETMTKELNDELMSCVTYMTQVCEDATLFAYRSAGSHGLRNPSVLQRCFRDMYTGCQHIFVDHKSYEDVSRAKLGVAQ